jgi:peptide/nickel transport system permease protein
MPAYILRRLLHMIPILVGISLLSFFVIQLAPGNFLTITKADPQVSKARIAEMEKKFGLDKPWPVQYGLWLKNIVLHRDFGYSFANKRPVAELIGERLLNTFYLSFSAMLITYFLAIPLGIISAVRQYSWIDKTSSLGAFIGLSIPEVFFALLMILMAARTGWFPIGGMESIDYDLLGFWGKVGDRLHHLALPALVLGTVPLAGRMRQMRGNLLDVLRMDYVTTARAKGLDERTVIWRHAVRNAINPLITLFGFTLAHLLSGAFLVEVVMSWPGLGRLTVDALFARDLYLVMGSVMMASVLLILSNLVADILLAWVDPRISYA